jgi:hypothetical protein
MTVAEVNELVTGANKKSSAVGQMEFISKEREKFGKRIRATAGNTVRKPNLTAFARFMGALDTIERLGSDEVARTANLTTEPEVFHDRCMDIAERLMQTAEAVREEVKKGDA